MIGRNRIIIFVIFVYGTLTHLQREQKHIT